MRRRGHVPPTTPVDSDTSPGTELPPSDTHSLLDDVSRPTDGQIDLPPGDPAYGLGIGVLVGAACWLGLLLLYFVLA